MKPAADRARRIATLSVSVSALLAILKITAGLVFSSTSVLADGFESAGDVVASGVVLFGLTVASRPPDEDHPYGHGRVETLSGFTIGLFLALGGVALCLMSLQRSYSAHASPDARAIWPLLVSISAKAILSGVKLRYAKRTGSAALKADAWNDTVDILSGVAALCALGLTLYDPQRFLAADHIGGLAVGVIVVFLGLRVVRETTMHLMDTMPDPDLMRQIRAIALEVPGALGVEKCFARKTGLQYHVDLHLEVDPDFTVRRSHEIAHTVQRRILAELPWVAAVLVHVEPHVVRYKEEGMP